MLRALRFLLRLQACAGVALFAASAGVCVALVRVCHLRGVAVCYRQVGGVLLARGAIEPGVDGWSLAGVGEVSCRLERCNKNLLFRGVIRGDDLDGVLGVDAGRGVLASSSGAGGVQRAVEAELAHCFGW